MAAGTDQRRREIERGGTEAPCPLCGLARVRRSDYIRCCRCGINWLPGENLGEDPRTARLRSMVEFAQAGRSKNQGEKR
jgi:hypothetical protein